MADEGSLPGTVTDRARTGFVVGSALSAFGNSMAWLAVTFLIYQRTSSVAVTALVTLCSATPSLVLAGRANRLLGLYGARMVFLASGLLLTLLGLVPAILSFAGQLSPQSLLGWYLATGIVVGLSGGAGAMVTRDLAPEGRIPEYNARITRAKAASAILGLLASGLLLSFTGPDWLFLLNALSYLAPLVPVLGLRMATTEPGANSSLRDAWSLLRRFPGLNAVFLATIAASVVGSFNIALPALGTLISPRPMAYSAVQAAYVAGGFTCAVVISRVRGRWNWGTAMGWSTVIAGVGLVLLALSTGLVDVPVALLAISCVLLLIIGTARSTRATILVAAIQEHSPPSHRAAYLTLFRLPPLVVIPLSHVLLGLLVDATTLAVAFAACGVLSLIAVAIGLRLRVAADIDAMYEPHESVHR